MTGDQTTAQGLVELLQGVVRTAGDEDGYAWFCEALESIASPFDEIRFRSLFSRAARRLGGGEASVTLDNRSPRFVGMIVWSSVDFGRAAFALRALSQLPASEHVALVETVFETGEIGEQASILRALPILPEPHRFVEIAIDSCRTNAQDVFEAIACENPYPVEHFPDHNFNQMVLKAVFLNIPIDRIRGLGGRVTAELIRMAEGYGSERRAAGRSVPEDIARIAELGGHEA